MGDQPGIAVSGRIECGTDGAFHWRSSCNYGYVAKPRYKSPFRSKPLDFDVGDVTGLRSRQYSDVSRRLDCGHTPIHFRIPYACGSRFLRVVLTTSALSLAIAVVLIEVADVDRHWEFALVVLAAILRERLFPFHRATVGLFDSRPILLAALLVNSNLGVFLIARVVMPLFPGLAAGTLPWLGGLALFTAIYTAVLGIAEREPRRLLVMLITSQASAILAGLATARHEGIAGALVQWIVLVISSTVLIAVYRGLEARVDNPFSGNGFLGFASSMPRLAVFFAFSGLTMVGLPGTLGFAGEDLLLHGILASYESWGVALPVAIALNAYNVFRLFARLFLGKDQITRNTGADALSRERWALTACLAVLVWGGLVPRQVVELQASVTAALVRTAGRSLDSHP